MTDDLQLPHGALEFVNEEEPSPAALGGLLGLSPSTFQGLVRVLEQRELIDHLEALAELAGAPRDIRKAAGASAYKLRSRGVKSRKKPATGRIEPAPVTVDLARVALASPPGLLGRYWLLLGSLPGVEALEVKGDADGGVEGVEALRQVNPSKVERLAREFESKRVRGIPVRVTADLAVRLITSWTEAMPVERRPPIWAEVDAWRLAALGSGANPARASARGNIAANERPLEGRALHALIDGGIHLPTPGVVQRILAGVRDVLDKPAIDVQAMDRKAAQLSREALGSWLSGASVRERLARWLEATADVLFAHKHLAAAAGFLTLADTVLQTSDGYTLVDHPFFHAIEIELLGEDLRRGATTS